MHADAAVQTEKARACGLVKLRCTCKSGLSNFHHEFGKHDDTRLSTRKNKILMKMPVMCRVEYKNIRGLS